MLSENVKNFNECFVFLLKDVEINKREPIVRA